jgi:glycosyltransferase involved in cell wall biosynthesis
MSLTLRQANQLIRAGRLEEALRIVETLSDRNPFAAHLYDLKRKEIAAAARAVSRDDTRSLKQRPLHAEQISDLIILTASCRTQDWKRHAIEATWGAELRRTGIRHYFVQGIPSLTSSCQLGQIIFVPCRDDYESLLLKLALAYEYLLTHETGFTHILKLDDDCYLNVAKFSEDLTASRPLSDYIAGAIHPLDERLNRRWHFGKCSDSRFDKPYAHDFAPTPYAKGGYGYILSRQAMGIVAREIPTFRAELERFEYAYEDLRIGQLMAAENIAITKISNYDIAPPGSPSIVGKSVIFDINQVADFLRYHNELAVERLRLGDAESFQRMNCIQAGTVQARLGFDHIYVVNLRSALDRRTKTQWILNNQGIEHELFVAFDGQSSVGQGVFQIITNRAPGEMAAHPEFSDLEKWRGSKFIESSGAVGYILTYVRLLRDAQARGFRRILILEDDVLLRHDFLGHLAQFLSSVGPDWKVLQLGASQYGWDSVDLAQAMRDGRYRPKSIDTCGSFAIAIDLSIADELVEEVLSFDAPFDHIPLGQIYERYPNSCHVAYPNIVIPDVSESYIRGGRDQRSHAIKMRWPLENFDYPRQRARIGVVLRQGSQLRSLPSPDLGVDLLCYRVSNDGLRPVHDLSETALPAEVLSPEAEDQWLNRPHALPVDRLFAVSRVCDGVEVLLEALDAPNRFGANTGDYRSREWLRPLQNRALASRRGRAAVIIPTRGRKEALAHAVASVLDQDWPDKEVIVVDENDSGSDASRYVKEHLQTLQQRGAPVRLITHARPRNAAAARNSGLLATQAEFVSFLDDDDAYLPGRLGHVIEVLASSAPEVGGAYCGYLGWNSKNNDPSRYPTDQIPRRLLNLEFHSHYICTNTVTYRREALLSVNGYDESFRRHQDLELNIRVFSRWEIAAFPEALVQLNPLPPDNANKLFDVKLFDVKARFLEKFDEEMLRFGVDRDAVFATHVKEMRNFTKDASSVRAFALTRPSRFSSAYLADLLAPSISSK